jgi:lipid A 3-O-deacylase
MKHLYATVFCTMNLLFSLHAVAQTNERRHMVRLYEDNDVLNLIGNRTDRSYTNGSRIDFFYESRLKKDGFFYRVLPIAGDSSTNVSGWSVAQIMVTPQDLNKVEYQPNDYPYAGSLFVTRSFYSYNPKKKFSYQTELLVGIRGRHALAKQTQIAIHSVINAAEPRGWGNQLNTQLLLNLLFIAEKNLLSWKNIVELNGGIQTRVGSLMDAVHVYPVLRIGKMSPYFDGYLDQYGSYRHEGRTVKMQYYLIFRPIASFVAYNAMLKGTRDNSQQENAVSEPSLPIAHHGLDMQMGIVIAYGNFGASYLLTRSASYDKGLYEHRFGTVELYFRW